LPWSPLAGGFLTGKFRRNQKGPENARRAGFDFPPVDKNMAYDVVDVMEAMGKEKGASIPQMALAWLLHQPGVTSPIIGAKTMEQLEDNIKSADVQLSEEELGHISDVTQPPKLYPQWMLEFQQNRARMIREQQSVK
jgi:aryl-alcohol dehydrogenase-like predicted oxidoreductase